MLFHCQLETNSFEQVMENKIIMKHSHCYFNFFNFWILKTKKIREIISVKVFFAVHIIRNFKFHILKKKILKYFLQIAIAINVTSANAFHV